MKTADEVNCHAAYYNPKEQFCPNIGNNHEKIEEFTQTQFLSTTKIPQISSAQLITFTITQKPITEVQFHTEAAVESNKRKVTTSSQSNTLDSISSWVLK